MNPLQTTPHLDTLISEARRRCNGAASHTLIQAFELATPWDRSTRAQRLTAVYAFDGTRTRAFVTDRPIAACTPAEFEHAADAAHAAIVDFDAPLQLVPTEVAKPWGREIWYTGVETRGVCEVTDSRHRSPLPWALALSTTLQGDAPLTLLKVLDPAPRPLEGDLYFEVHDHKHEVYIVTAIDRNAWPNGVGGIRFGMNQPLRARYADDDRFRADYLAAVRRYEIVRRAIDTADSSASPEQHAEETRLRAEMEAFTTLRALRVGDVIDIPAGYPHALQHGVRVVEFQTPLFERRIISFDQPVVTQEHWDSEAAVARMRLDAPPTACSDRVVTAQGAAIDRIADLPDLTTWRATFGAGARHALCGNSTHRICIALTGAIALDDVVLEAGDACLVPGSARPLVLANLGRSAAVAVLSGPSP